MPSSPPRPPSSHRSLENAFTIAPPGPQAFRPRLELRPQLSRLSGFQMGLLSLHGCQLLIIKQSLSLHVQILLVLFLNNFMRLFSLLLSMITPISTTQTTPFSKQNARSAPIEARCLLSPLLPLSRSVLGSFAHQYCPRYL